VGVPLRDAAAVVGGSGCCSAVVRGGGEETTASVVDPNSHGGSCVGERGNERRCIGTPNDGGVRVWPAPPGSGGAVRDDNATIVGVAICGGGGQPVNRARSSRNSVRRPSIALP
jgi:hypothetical protein